MTQVSDALSIINERTGGARIRVGLTLGSGLGHLVDAVEGVAIDYADLPGFPQAGVSGHMPRLKIGTLEGTPVAILGGRSHYYEHGRANIMRGPIEVLKGLGAESLILTNAAGSLRPDIPPGELMLISDHINLSGTSPLIGEPTDARFVNLTAAYDPAWRALFEAAAISEAVDLRSGVYAWFSGPMFETPAEIRMAQILGADAVGMSTVPEVILGRFFGLRCAAISVITNMAAGMSSEHISHEHTKASAPAGAAKFERVLRHVLRGLDRDAG